MGMALLMTFSRSRFHPPRTVTGRLRLESLRVEEENPPRHLRSLEPPRDARRRRVRTGTRSRGRSFQRHRFSSSSPCQRDPENTRPSMCALCVFFVRIFVAQEQLNRILGFCTVLYSGLLVMVYSPGYQVACGEGFLPRRSMPRPR